MPKFEVSITVTFETEAPNTTEAKGRVLDLNMTEQFKGKDLPLGLIYKRKSLVKCQKIT